MQVLKKGCIRDGLGNRRGTKSAQSVHRACTKGEQRRNKEGTKREQRGNKKGFSAISAAIKRAQGQFHAVHTKRLQKITILTSIEKTKVFCTDDEKNAQRMTGKPNQRRYQQPATWICTCRYRIPFEQVGMFCAFSQ